MNDTEIYYSLEERRDDFKYFTDRFTKFFSRSEPREQYRKYLEALIAPVERKNGWQMAEHVGDDIPDAMQRLLFRSHWDVSAVRDELQDFVVEEHGDEEGIGVLDETGFIKKGNHSAGVQRQYTGTAGKIENCQIGTFLTYATKHVHCFLDCRLYLPATWCEDSERRRRAKIPDEVTFQTKVEHGMEMLQHAWERGVPMRWVTGDTVYGVSSALRNMVHFAGKNYVFAVTKNTRFWKNWPEPVRQSEHEKRTAGSKPQFLPMQEAAELISNLAPSRWKRYSVGDGEKGHRVYDWTRVRVVESTDGYPTRQAWLLARRSVSDPTDIAYYISNAMEASLFKLAQVAATRFTVEQCFEEGKSEIGLDHYEVRNWSSWYRHMTLSMMAHTFLTWVRAKNSGKKGACMSSMRKSPFLKYAN